jgi:hypothetical protein
MPFLVAVFFIIVFWIIGYYPAGLLPNTTINFGAVQLSLAHIFLFLSILFLAYSIRPPFRKFSLMLVAIWVIGFLGLTYEQAVPGAVVAGGITLSNFKSLKD